MSKRHWVCYNADWINKKYYFRGKKKNVQREVCSRMFHSILSVLALWIGQLVRQKGHFCFDILMLWNNVVINYIPLTWNLQSSEGVWAVVSNPRVVPRAGQQPEDDAAGPGRAAAVVPGRPDQDQRTLSVPPRVSAVDQAETGNKSTHSFFLQYSKVKISNNWKSWLIICLSRRSWRRQSTAMIFLVSNASWRNTRPSIRRLTNTRPKLSGASRPRYVTWLMQSMQSSVLFSSFIHPILW